MLRDVVDLLQCPHCGGRFSLVEGGLRCCRGHGFDVARQGYVSLLSGRAPPGTGDTAAMVAAREAFLAAGHYGPTADAVAAAAARVAVRTPGSVVDIGAGTGHFLAAALDRIGGDGHERAGLALDASKHAARRAARAHPRIGAVVCDAWRPMPVRSATAAVVLVILAPRNAEEIRRLLRQGGGLVLVTPTRRHVHELVGTLGLITVDARKTERLEAQLGPHLALAGQQTSEYPMRLGREEVRQLVGMGPSARHMTEAALAERVERLPDPVTATASFTVSTYTPSC